MAPARAHPLLYPIKVEVCHYVYFFLSEAPAAVYVAVHPDRASDPMHEVLIDTERGTCYHAEFREFRGKLTPQRSSHEQHHHDRNQTRRHEPNPTRRSGPPRSRGVKSRSLILVRVLRCIERHSGLVFEWSGSLAHGTSMRCFDKVL